MFGIKALLQNATNMGKTAKEKDFVSVIVSYKFVIFMKTRI